MYHSFTSLGPQCSRQFIWVAMLLRHPVNLFGTANRFVLFLFCFFVFLMTCTACMSSCRPENLHSQGPSSLWVVPLTLLNCYCTTINRWDLLFLIDKFVIHWIRLLFQWKVKGRDYFWTDLADIAAAAAAAVAASQSVIHCRTSLCLFSSEVSPFLRNTVQIICHKYLYFIQIFTNINLYFVLLT